MGQSFPPFPADELRAATTDPIAHSDIDALHSELGAQKPSAARIGEHVERLRRWDDLVAPLERWWLDPRTQLFIEDLTAIGL